MRYPLDNISNILVDGQGAFGAIRKHDIHTGIDLYCQNNEPVYAICNGVVRSVAPFTGPKANLPWWNDTDAVIIETNEKVCGIYIGKILYGEIEACVNIGDNIKEGQIIGYVKTVLKKDKGLPMNMLHLEHYHSKYNGEGEIWNLNSKRPKYLKDPTIILFKIYSENRKKIIKKVNVR